jgi:hypothetical protein
LHLGQLISKHTALFDVHLDELPIILSLFSSTSLVISLYILSRNDGSLISQFAILSSCSSILAVNRILLNDSGNLSHKIFHLAVTQYLSLIFSISSFSIISLMIDHKVATVHIPASGINLTRSAFFSLSAKNDFGLEQASTRVPSLRRGGGDSFPSFSFISARLTCEPTDNLSSHFQFFSSESSSSDCFDFLNLSISSISVLTLVHHSETTSLI